MLGLSLLVLAGTAWRAWQVRADLVAASDSAVALRDALTEGDKSAAERELARLQQHADAAADGTSGPAWSVATHLPALGDDADAVGVVSRVLADLSQDGLPPIVDAAGRLEAGSFTPQGGRLPVADIESLQDPVRRADEAFAAADQELAAVETDGLVDAVGVRYDEVADQVADASSSLDAAQRAVQVLPTMLGAEGDRRFLMIFQNNAEVRATGGLPGAMSLIETRDGRIAMTRQVAPGDFPVTGKPVLPLTEEELDTFGIQLGTYMQDANFTPDFPRTAQLMAAHWARKEPTTLDGVVSVDPVALSYLLEATGPVTVDGITLTPQNAVIELLNNTYLRLPDPEEQNAFFRRVARDVFAQVSLGGGDPATLIRALARGVEERRVLVHSFEDAEQEQLTGTAIAGELPTEPSDRPQVAVSFNDATGSKMSYYLDYQVEVTPTACQDGTQQLSGHLTMSSNAPGDAESLPVSITGGGNYGVEAGAQIVIADLFGPVDGTITKVRIDGKPAHAKVASFQGRPTTQLALFFESGQDVDITWQMDSGAGQTGDTDVWVTPGVQPERESSVAVSGCG